MSIVKEFYENSVDMRGPNDPHAKPIVTGNVHILRFADNRSLKIQDLAALFNEAAKDFPAYIQAGTIGIKSDHIEIELRQTLSGYTKLPPKVIGARG